MKKSGLVLVISAAPEMFCTLMCEKVPAKDYVAGPNPDSEGRIHIGASS